MTGGITRSNRLLIGALAFAVITFTLGIVAGVRIGQYQQIEAGIEKKAGKKLALVESTALRTLGTATFPAPDKPDRVPVRTAGKAATGGRDADVGYVILLGTFSRKNARQLLLQINKLPELASIKPKKCKSVNEVVPNRRPAFYARHPGDTRLYQVYVGCFDRKETGQSVLWILDRAGLLKNIKFKFFKF